LRSLVDALLAAERRGVLPEPAEVLEESERFFSAKAAVADDATATGCDLR
jgi:hypothetical protein